MTCVHLKRHLDDLIIWQMQTDTFNQHFNLFSNARLNKQKYLFYVHRDLYNESTEDIM